MTEEELEARKAQQEAKEDEDDVSEEEDERLPFANARIVRILKANLKREHQVKRDVKLAANKLVGEILSDIAQSMDQEEYFTLSIEHFNKAARKYKEIALTQKRIRRIQKVLEKQRAELDEIVTEIELDLPSDHVTQQ
jgi:hypothetical protein